MMKRREARRIAFELIYEAGVRGVADDAGLREIYKNARENREFEEDEYITNVFFGVFEKLAVIDEKIAACARGWKTDRLSKVSQAIMRLCVYEMTNCQDIPYVIAINEAVELAKTFDHEKAPAFINGVLNAVALTEGLKSEQ